MQGKKFDLQIKDNAPASVSDRDKGSTRANRGTGVLVGNKRALGNGKCPFKGKKSEPQDDSGDGKEWRATREWGNKLVCGDDGVVVATSLSQLLTVEGTLEPYGTVTGEGKQNRKDKQPVKMSLPLFRFLDKKKGWNNFMKAKIRFSSYGDDVVTMFSQVKRKVSSCRLVRIPSKILVIRLKLRMVRSLLKKKVTKQFEQDLEQEADENVDVDKKEELCKKRILMGVRCKPLSSSGTLKYDEDGIFLPETPCHL